MSVPFIISANKAGCKAAAGRLHHRKNGAEIPPSCWTAQRLINHALHAFVADKTALAFRQPREQTLIRLLLGDRRLQGKDEHRQPSTGS